PPQSSAAIRTPLSPRNRASFSGVTDTSITSTVRKPCPASMPLNPSRRYRRPQPPQTQDSPKPPAQFGNLVDGELASAVVEKRIGIGVFFNLLGQSGCLEKSLSGGDRAVIARQHRGALRGAPLYFRSEQRIAVPIIVDNRQARQPHGVIRREDG